MNYLLDTNVIIDYLQAKIPAKGMLFVGSVIDEEAIISVISKMETPGFNFPSKKEQNLIETFIQYSNVLNIEDDIVAETIQVKKTKKIKLPDAIIAATALVHDCTLVTRNIPDFKGIDRLKLLTPYDL